MTREIKFRALIKDTGKWAYGYFLKTPITTEFSCEGQFLDSGGYGRYCIIQEGVANEIDVKTLGQFTGLLDKNGKEIYEGDIVRGDVIYDDNSKEGGIGEVKFGPKIGFYSHSGPNYLTGSEVVGNVYEHKHLLK